MKQVDTFVAKIYVGFLEMDSGVMHSLDEAQVVCQEYVDRVGLCVTLDPTQFIYTGGGEPGCVVGLINYPRFASDPDSILWRAIELGRKLMVTFRQYRVSVVTTTDTYMLENKEFGGND